VVVVVAVRRMGQAGLAEGSCAVNSHPHWTCLCVETRVRILRGLGYRGRFHRGELRRTGFDGGAGSATSPDVVAARAGPVHRHGDRWEPDVGEPLRARSSRFSLSTGVLWSPRVETDTSAPSFSRVLRDLQCEIRVISSNAFA